MDILNIGALVTAFISACYTFFLSLLITIVQVVTWPVNALIYLAFPSFATQVAQVTDYLSNLLGYFPYALSFLPPGILTLLLFILGTEIVLMYMFQSTYYVAKLWRIVGKVKFW